MSVSTHRITVSFPFRVPPLGSDHGEVKTVQDKNTFSADGGNTGATPPTAPRFLRFLLPAVLIVGALAIGLAVRQLFFSPADSVSKPTSAIPTSAEIEQRWGVRLSQVGVTAEGGLIDFRFIVLDPDKALAMVQDVKNVPILVNSTGQVVNSAAMMSQKHVMNAGTTYFFLYRNTQGAISPGSRISVVFGDLRLDNVPVQ